jgi:hypothetical protein
MTIIVTPLVVFGSIEPTTSQSIIIDAMEIIGKLGAGETISSEDNDVCLKKLQSIFKEMPIHGFSWAKVTVVPASLVWDSLLPNQVIMPADYFNNANISYVANSENVDLRLITKAEYDNITVPTDTALYPSQIHIASNNIGYLYPIPTVDPQLKITYQALQVDAVLSDRPDILEQWIGLMGLWLAYEICPKFDVPMEKARDIEGRYLVKKRMALAYASELSPISFTVYE